MLRPMLVIFFSLFVAPCFFASAATAEDTSVYSKNCVSCHGQEGTAATPVGAALKIASFKGSTYSAQQIETLLRENQSHTGLGLKLTDQELGALVEALNKLASTP